MPYTLVMMSVWLVLAVVLGIVTGWLLRNVTARRQISRSRSQRSDVAELERLQRRVAELEGIAAERDRLAAAFTARTGLGAEPTPAGTTTPAGTSAGADASRGRGPSAGTSADPTVDPAANGTSPVTSPVASAIVADAPTDESGSVAGAVAEVDGRAIVQDDLKAVEGIGPTVEELCHGIGIRGWSDLAHTEVSLLRTMLEDAGARFKMHDPTTWPHQAELLAGGRWDEFAQLTASLRSGADDRAT